MAVERILASCPFLTRLLPLRPQNRCRSRSSRASPPGRRASGRCVGGLLEGELFDTLLEAPGLSYNLERRSVYERVSDGI